MKIDNNVAKKLKLDFPIFKNNPGLVYLDNAATSQRPKQVIKALTDFYEKDNANPGRGTHDLSEKAMERYNKSREAVAGLINADSKEIIFTRNATDSLNILAHTISSIIPKGRNEILLTEMEHHSNIVPWQELAKRNNMDLKFVKITKDFQLDIQDLKNKLTNKTALVSFTMVSNVLGTVNDVNSITKLAKQKGALTVIDAAQAVQHMKVNVREIGCDFLVFSSHKMLGPTGLGILYGRKELLEKMHPRDFGGGMIRRVDLNSTEFAEVPEKFEAGTQNVAEAAAIEEAINHITRIGIENIAKWEKELVRYAINKLKAIPNIKLYTPNVSSSIISFNLGNVHPHDVAELLNRASIAIRAGHQCAMPLMNVLGAKGGVCRASFSFYNTFEDVDKLVVELKKISEKFK